MANAPSAPPPPSHTLHGDELSWLDLMVIGAVPARYQPPAPSQLPIPRAPALNAPTDVADAARAAGSLHLLDPEGVTVARLSIEKAEADSGRQAWLTGDVEAVSGVDHLDHRAWRLPPGAVAERWPPGPVIALWQPAPVPWAVREATRLLARTHGGAVLSIVPVPSGRETSPSANLGARLAHVETTGDAPDRTVVVPSPDLAITPEDVLLKAAVAAKYGATALATVPNELAALGDRAEQTREAASALGVDLVPLDLAALGLDSNQAQLTDEELDHLLTAGEELPAWFAEPAVAAEIRRLHRPRSRAGMTVLLSGLSGSGKSTVARALAVRLLESEARSVTLLDGDVVRHHLSKGLGFARADRDTNVRRIGFVASEITKAGGIAICCPIAPYDQTRKDVRAMVEAEGGFVLVHVATPLEECERRDRKGLYAKARAGEIPEFTGISDPYEVPDDAELTIDTTGRTIDACVDDVITTLRRLGYLPLR